MSDMATHPIILHTDLHAEDERAPQTQFVVARQVAFPEAPATTGSVRAAAPPPRVPPTTPYRASPPSSRVSRAWAPPLVVARPAGPRHLP